MKLKEMLSVLLLSVVVAAAKHNHIIRASPFKGSNNSQVCSHAFCLMMFFVPMFTSYDQISDLCGFTLEHQRLLIRELSSPQLLRAHGSPVIWASTPSPLAGSSTGWGIEGSFRQTDKPYQFKAGDKRGEYSVTYMQDTPIFASTDTYAQIWLQNYSDAYEFEIVDFTLLNSKGEDITKAVAETTAPAETTAAPEETKAPEETTAPAEETVEVSIDTAEVETFEVETAEVETAEVDTAEVAITEAATAEAATAEAPADNAADANKGNPETGVAGVAVAAGVVALAGAAVVASRKRK